MAPMVIRFQCACCSQPIEVDDDLALKVVGCPYCQKTVIAPEVSTLVTPEAIPVASPLQSGDGSAASAPPALTGSVAVEGTSNPLAVVAFVLACVVLVLLLAIGLVAAGHDLELEEFYRDLEQAGPGFSAQLEAMNRLVREHGGSFPTWLIVLSLLEFAALATCLAAIICGVLALRRAARRPFAVTALGICGAFLVVSCLGVFLS